MRCARCGTTQRLRGFNWYAHIWVCPKCEGHLTKALDEFYDDWIKYKEDEDEVD